MHEQSERSKQWVEQLTLRIEVLDANAGWNCSSLHSQNNLHDTSHGTGSFSVADIGLDGSDQERVSLAVLEEHVGNAIQLDWVTDGRAGAVALKVRGVIRVEIASKSICCTDDGLLANSAWLRDTAGLTVGVGSGTSDDTADWVAVAEGIGESLEV